MVCYGVGVGSWNEECVPNDLIASRVTEAALCFATQKTRIRKLRTCEAKNGKRGGRCRAQSGRKPLRSEVVAGGGRKMVQLFPLSDRLNPPFPASFDASG